LYRRGVNIIRATKLSKVGLGGNLACMREKTNTWRFLVRNLEGKKLIGRLQRRWEYGTKLSLNK
jgi:hypothetical protein